MHHYNFVETILFFFTGSWFLCFGISWLTGHKKDFLAWTTKTLQGFWQKWWRYIIVFAIAYCLGKEDYWRLTTHF